MGEEKFAPPIINNASLLSLKEKYIDLIKKYEHYSYTLKGYKNLVPLLEYMRNKKIKSIVDIGSNYGIITNIMKEYFQAEIVQGIEIDTKLVEITKTNFGNSVEYINADFFKIQGLGKADLVTSFGVLEHNLDWDTFIKKVKLVMNPDAYFLIEAPNLGSWLNRIALLFGYQPRDLEISNKKLYGTLYGSYVTGHAKLATYKSFKEFLKDNGFKIIKAKPISSKEKLWVNIIDTTLSPFVSLSRRYLILAQQIKA